MIGCIYFNTTFGPSKGKCRLFNPEVGNGFAGIRGCDENGKCIVTISPDPNQDCPDYESDCVCIICGADLNVGDCDC